MAEKLVDEMFMEMINLPAFEEYTFWQELKDRRIIINQVIDESILERVIMQILKFNRIDDNNPHEPRKPIEIILNTHGGDLSIGMVLCAVIEQSKTPVWITAMGTACSMGALILMAGHRRRCYPYTWILIHQAMSGVSGQIDQIVDTANYTKRKKDEVRDYVLAHTRITPRKYNKMSKSEWWLSAKEALELGIVDEIIGVR